MDRIITDNSKVNENLLNEVNNVKKQNKELIVKNMDLQEQLRLYRVSNSSDLYVVELSDEEIKIIDQKELDEWYKSAEEFDGFLGFTIRGKLMK